MYQLFEVIDCISTQEGGDMQVTCPFSKDITYIFQITISKKTVFTVHS